MKTTIDGNPVKELNFHQTGEDAEFLWIEFVLEDGRKIHTLYFKGTL